MKTTNFKRPRSRLDRPVDAQPGDVDLALYSVATRGTSELARDWAMRVMRRTDAA